MSKYIEKLKELLLPKYKLEKKLKNRERIMRQVYKSISENKKSDKQ